MLLTTYLSALTKQIETANAVSIRPSSLFPSDSPLTVHPVFSMAAPGQAAPRRLGAVQFR